MLAPISQGKQSLKAEISCLYSYLRASYYLSGITSKSLELDGGVRREYLLRPLKTMSNALFGLNTAHRALFNENGATPAAAMIASAFVCVACTGLIFPDAPSIAGFECRDTPYSIMSCQ